MGMGEDKIEVWMGEVFFFFFGVKTDEVEGLFGESDWIVVFTLVGSPALSYCCALRFFLSFFFL